MISISNNTLIFYMIIIRQKIKLLKLLKIIAASNAFFIY